jgi:hypothetical protein
MSEGYEHPSFEHQPLPRQPYPPQGPPPGAGLAIGSLVCSIAGLIVCAPAAIAGIVMGHIAYARSRRGTATGGAVAVAGFVIGYLGLLVWGIMIPFVLHELIKYGAFG